jgi:hypothetical protein
MIVYANKSSDDVIPRAGRRAIHMIEDAEFHGVPSVW